MQWLTHFTETLFLLRVMMGSRVDRQLDGLLIMVSFFFSFSIVVAVNVLSLGFGVVFPRSQGARMTCSRPP